MTGRRALAGLYWGAVAALALPLGLIALTSLADGPIVGFPLGTPSLRWYGAALADPAWSRAFALSAALATASAVLAVATGAWIALAAASLQRRWMRPILLAGTLIPLITPGILHAMALRIAIRTVGLDPGPAAILLGHVIHATPYAAIMVGARLATMPPELVDAAHDLGAAPASAFVHVVVPWLRPALLGAGGLAALASFDDFIRSFFLGGYDPTLPVLLFARLRSGLTPEINAVATLILLLTYALAAAANPASRRPRATGIGRERPAWFRE
jgi:spermidine/putrescine transport system permease protein